jgi:hypothetical protein
MYVYRVCVLISHTMATHMQILAAVAGAGTLSTSSGAFVASPSPYIDLYLPFLSPLRR